MKRYRITILVAILVLVSEMLTGCAAPQSSPKLTPKSHIYTHGIIVVGGDGEPIELINNPDATNPTFAELVAFIERDRTDEYSYIFGPPKNAFVCSDFAETVHNNAEAAGIRAAWVGIDIEGEAEGHALNAFQTTDLGLVYIDCTGKGLWSESPNRSSWDRRAYVEIGKPYAVTDITDRTQSKVSVTFKFFVTTPIGADNLVLEKLEERTLRSLELLGWIRLPTYEERSQKSRELLEWLRTHDIKVLGQRWMQEWMREHETESRCSWEEPVGYHGGTSSWGSESHYTSKGWSIRVDYLVDWLETPCWFQPDVFYHVTPWFQPEEKLIEVDGVPIVWKVSGSTNPMGLISWSKPFKGVVKDIHIHW